MCPCVCVCVFTYDGGALACRPWLRLSMGLRELRAKRERRRAGGISRSCRSSRPARVLVRVCERAPVCVRAKAKAAAL